MTWNGSGTYSLDPSYYPEVNGTTIDAARYNGLMADIATGINKALAKDGQNAATANLPMGGYRLTGLGAGSVAGHSLRYEQVSMRVAAETTVTLTATASDLGAVEGGSIVLDGASVTVTAFAATTVGTVKLIRFNGINTLTHAASFFLPNGGSNITTASGDSALVVYTSAGWRFLSYVKANGQPLQAAAPALHQLTAATATNSISNGDYAQVWNWAITTASKIGFKFAESSASSGSGATLVHIETGSSSTARAIYCKWDGATAGEFGFDTSGGLLIKSHAAASAVGQPIAITAAAASGASSAGGAVTITGGAAGATAGEGGDVTLTGGASTSTSIGGDIIFAPGAGASAGYHGRVVANRTFILASAEVPTISSGAGSGATIEGNNNAFRVVIGTAPSTTMVFNFTRNLAGGAGSSPIGVAQLNRNTVNCYLSTSNTAATVIFDTTPTAGDILQVVLFPITTSTV